MGSGICVCRLCASLAVYRPGTHSRPHGGDAQVCAAGRHYRGIYHISVIRSMGSLGPAQASLLIVIAQIIVAYLIELFGLFGAEKAPFAWHKLIGAAIAIAGIMVFER